MRSSLFAFDREGKRLLVGDADAVSLVELGGRTVRIACEPVRAVAGFADQVWVVTVDDALVRFDLQGRRLGDAIALPFAAVPSLVVAPHGPAGAVWGTGPAVGLCDDLGTIATCAHGGADAIIPITARRVLSAAGSRVQLPAGTAIELAPGTRVLAGAVLADGKSAALVTAHGGRTALTVVALGTCHVTGRCEVPAGAVRLAGRRALAVIHSDARRLDVIDLRAGRPLGAIELAREIDDVAVDPDGRRLALRRGAEIEIAVLADELRDSRTRATAAPSDEMTSNAAIAVPRVEAPPVPAPPARGVSPARDASPLAAIVRRPLAALAPRTPRAPIERAAALALLDRELRGVALLALCAIADAWDTRRLGYGNEGQHPYEHEVAAILGMNRGFATEHLAAARAHRAEHEARIAADPTWRAPGTPVGDLIEEIALSPRAADVLVVIAAAALWGEIARLYGILANDPGRPIVDELLVQQVLAPRHSRHDIAAELDPRAPLARLGVVRVDPRRARPFAELSVEPVVLDRLRAAAPDLGAAVTLRAPDRALEALAMPAGAIERALAALAKPPRGPVRIAVRGRAGAGRRTLLAVLAGEAGRTLAVADALALPRTREAFSLALAQVLRRIQLAGALPCVAGLDRVAFDDETGCEVATDVVAAHPGPVAMIGPTDGRVPFPPGHLAIDLPALPEAERDAVWTGALRTAELGVADLGGLVARYRIGPGVIHRAATAVRAAGGLRGDDDAGPALETFIRQARDVDLGQHARRVEQLATWSNVVLPPDVLDSLRELIGRVRHRRTVFEDWGMGHAVSTSRGLTALFQGQPGTGKTLVAGVIARELGLDLYQVDLSKVMSKWIGETERNLAAIFDAAEDGQVVLLFDEADSLFAKRTEVRSSNDRYANLEVNYLLQRLDAFEGIAILTTNFGGSIDPALKRRMSYRLSFPFPDEETREQLWRAHLPPTLPVAGQLALDALARKYQLSGGYIRNACLRAAFLAAQEESALCQHHLDRAVALEFAELGKLSTSGAIG